MWGLGSGTSGGGMTETWQETVSRDVRAAFADLNRDHAQTLAALTSARRLAMVCELADFARESYAIQARKSLPDASPAEIHAEVLRRMRRRGE